MSENDINDLTPKNEKTTFYNEDMILALAGQFKQLSHEPEKFRRLNGIQTHDLCDAGTVL